MAQSDKKKRYDAAYKSENIKRVPLDMQKSAYDRLKAAADAAGESVNGWIKGAIEARLALESESARKE